MKRSIKLLVGFIFLSFLAVAQTPKVFLMKIQAEIDPRTNRYTELALEEAKNLDVDYVILELDTYGGALNDADEIRTRILNFEKPIYVYINKDAASAGALISIACDSIYMAPGSSIGAATVVVADGSAAPDKYQSYMRSIMRSTAEATKRNPSIAEAMVDEDFQLDSIKQAGKVLTLSVSEAIALNYCEAEVLQLDDIMKRSGVSQYELIEYELGVSDKVIAFFLNPLISGILILVIIGGIWFEFQTPGIGFPLFAAITAAVLYFIPYYLNGLAENWEIILFFIGIVLLAIEIFVIPGFGVAGILGIGFVLISLVLVMVNNQNFDFSFVPEGNLTQAILVAVVSVFGGIAMLFILGVRFAESFIFKRIALQDTQAASEGFMVRAENYSMIGKTGIAHTVLRPGGKVMIEGILYDAITRGNYIEKDTPVEVIGEEGSTLRVKEKE